MTLETNYHDFLKSKGLETDAGRPGGQIFSDDFRAKLPEELQIASYWAVEAIDIIHPNKMSPFVLYVSFLDPHPPFYGPLDRLDTLLIDPSFLKKPSGHSLFSRTRADFFMQSEFENTPDERSNADSKYPTTQSSKPSAKTTSSSKTPSSLIRILLSG